MNTTDAGSTVVASKSGVVRIATGRNPLYQLLSCGDNNENGFSKENEDWRMSAVYRQLTRAGRRNDFSLSY
jgi:hypothetical protein